jgi:hypothetical protein
MYKNTQNGKIAVSAELNDKTKTYLITFEDGKTTSVSASTFKRWYKKIDDGKEVEKAGDGTPLAEVGKEIAKQAKEKAKDAKKAEAPKKERKPKKEKAPKVAIETRQAELEKIVKPMGCTIKSYTNSPRKMNVVKEGKVLGRVYAGDSKAVLCVSVKALPDGVKPTRVRNCPLGAAIDVSYEELEKTLKDILPKIDTKKIENKKSKKANKEEK